MMRFAFILACAPRLVLGDVITPQGRTVDCYCTDSSGARIELGETICLQVDGRMFMAQCQMSLNVPMWRDMQEGCVSSGLALPVTPFGADALQKPVQPFAVHPKI